MVGIILKRYCVPAVALIAILWAYQYLTRDIGCGTSAEGRILLNAMATYKYEHERYPSTLCDLQPILRNNTTPTTTVNHVFDDTYDVRIALSPQKIARLQVKYRIDEAGKLEKYHVERLSR